MPSIILGIIVTILLIVGLAGTLIPALPGIGLVFGGIVLYAWQTGFSTVGVETVVVLGLMGVLALLADFAGSAVGAKYGGGKKWAMGGAVVGGIIGALSGPLGIFAGAFLGALIGALIEGQSHGQALRAAVFSMVGIVGSAAVQFLLALTMIIAFVMAVFV